MDGSMLFRRISECATSWGLRTGKTISGVAPVDSMTLIQNPINRQKRGSLTTYSGLDENSVSIRRRAFSK